MDFAPVQREHVEKALADLDAGVSPAGFRDSTTYDVIHQGRPYPPNQLIALALKHATGRVATGDDFGDGRACPPCMSEFLDHVSGQRARRGIFLRDFCQG